MCSVNIAPGKDIMQHTQKSATRTQYEWQHVCGIISVILEMQNTAPAAVSLHLFLCPLL